MTVFAYSDDVFYFIYWYGHVYNEKKVHVRIKCGKIHSMYIYIYADLTNIFILDL